MVNILILTTLIICKDKQLQKFFLWKGIKMNDMNSVLKDTTL